MILGVKTTTTKAIISANNFVEDLNQGPKLEPQLVLKSTLAG